MGKQRPSCIYSRTYSLFYQLARITAQRGSLRHDDRLDALAIAVHYWTDLMSQDADEVLLASREQALIDQVEEWMSSITSIRLL